MHCPIFRKQRLFIGSGVIEAGCRTIIGSRLKQSGTFWTLRGAREGRTDPIGCHRSSSYTSLDRGPSALWILLRPAGRGHSCFASRRVPETLRRLGGESSELPTKRARRSRSVDEGTRPQTCGSGKGRSGWIESARDSSDRTVFPATLTCEA